MLLGVVLSFVTATASAHVVAQQAASPACARAAAPRMTGSVTKLTADNFYEELAACEGLAVVKFWAPWCRTCKALAPKYDSVVFQHLDEPRVRFFECNFKEAGALCLSQKIMALPTIHFYMPEIGRVNRVSVDAKTATRKISAELDRFLGEDGQLDTLQNLQRGGREALVRYTDVMRMLQALAAKRGEPPSAEEDKAFASRFEALANDEYWLRDLERLFNWLDADSSGDLSATEIQAAVNVLCAQSKRSPPGSDADADVEGSADGDEGDDTPSLAQMSPCELDAPAIGQLIAAAQAKAEAPEGAEAVLDFGAFVRLMTSQAVAELSTPAGQGLLQQAFEALDTNGDGTVSLDEMLKAVGDVCLLLPAEEQQRACVDASLVEEAFDAFDADESGAIDYEEFVAMVSGRGMNAETAVYDEFRGKGAADFVSASKTQA